MKGIIYILPVLCGVAIAVQAIVNGQLRQAIGSPVLAALMSFLIGTVVLAGILLFTQNHYPSWAEVKHIAWIKWMGGVLGAFFVTAVIVSVQKLPSANMFAVIITSQFITALLIDHYGWLGTAPSPAHPGKIIGVALLIAGAYLIVKR